MTDDGFERRYQGAAVLQALLVKSGSLADVEDVAGAFREAHGKGVPAQVVIQALWEDEPRFSSPDEARTLFANLLGLFDLIAAGGEVDLGLPRAPLKRERAPRPEPFGADGPDEAFVRAALAWFDDHPKDRERLAHQFSHRQDALVSWLEEQGLDDDAFVLAHGLVSDAWAVLTLGGHTSAKIAAPRPGEVPEALAAFLEDGVFEAEQHEERPLPEATATQVRALVKQAVAALWEHRET